MPACRQQSSGWRSGRPSSPLPTGTGAEVVHLTIHSRDAGADQGVQVVVPAADVGHARGKPLLVVLYGHDGSGTSDTEDESFFRALAKLGRRAPVVALPTTTTTATGTTAPRGAGAAT